MSWYREQLEQYLGNLDVVGQKAYDVGGAQNPVLSRCKKWEVAEYKILDLPGYDLDQPHGGDADGDWVFCLEVFEYLLSPRTAMHNIAGLLKPGGRAVISAPLVYPVHAEVPLDSLRYTERGLARMAAGAGLEVAKVTYRRTAGDELTRYYKRDGMKAARGQDHEVTGYIMELTK